MMTQGDPLVKYLYVASIETATDRNRSATTSYLDHCRGAGRTVSAVLAVPIMMNKRRGWLAINETILCSTTQYVLTSIAIDLRRVTRCDWYAWVSRHGTLLRRRTPYEMEVWSRAECEQEQVNSGIHRGNHVNWKVVKFGVTAAGFRESGLKLRTRRTQYPLGNWIWCSMIHSPCR